VKEIAEFAVSEFNKQSHKKLVFQKVVSCLRQHLKGRSYYRLVITVRDESLSTSPTVNYEGYVYDIRWKHFRKLDFFYQVN
jgi:hypothetical protein